MNGKPGKLFEDEDWEHTVHNRVWRPRTGQEAIEKGSARVKVRGVKGIHENFIRGTDKAVKP